MIPGTRFELRYTYANTATPGAASPPEEGVARTVRGFALDRFEVSVSRFLQFVYAYETVGRPHEGQGAHPGFPTSGWQEAWNSQLAEVPDAQRGLESMLNRKQQPTATADPTDDRPVRGANWYMAFAFCIWDGGRLPTEAEWALAASGGDKDRLYPWANADPQIAHDRAVYSDPMQTSGEPARVGSLSDGQGRWGQDDLAGNLAEYVADAYQNRLPESCELSGDRGLDEHECLQQQGNNRVIRGGSFMDGPMQLRNVSRSYAVVSRDDEGTVGFRCARDLGGR